MPPNASEIFLNSMGQGYSGLIDLRPGVEFRLYIALVLSPSSLTSNRFLVDNGLLYIDAFDIAFYFGAMSRSYRS